MVDATTKPLIKEMRSDERKARAAERARELLNDFSEVSQETDHYYLPPEIHKCDGWVRDWKRYSVLNSVDTTHISELLRAGWEFVPRSRHPELAAFGSKDEHIFNRGMVLMEIPEEVYSAMQDRDKRAASNQVTSIHKKAMGDALAKQFDGMERRPEDKRVNFVKRTVERLPVAD